MPINARVRQIAALTVEQQKNLINECYNDLNGVFVIFLLNTGLRASEFCNLRWKDYNKEQRMIFVEKSKTNNGIRHIPLLSICVQIIETRPKRSEYIFTQNNGRPVTAQVLKRTYMRLRKTTGIETLTNHVYRHTFATRLVEQGAHPKAVMALLGHSSVAFTMSRYTHANVEYLHEQISLLSS